MVGLKKGVSKIKMSETHSPYSEEIDHPTRQVHFFQRLASESLKPLKVPENEKLEVNAHLTDARKKVMERFPSELEGLNMSRVNSFFEQYHLRDVSLTVISTRRQSEFLEFFTKTVGEVSTPESRGIYIPSIDLAVVFRDEEKEAENGVEYTESLIVHERAHGANEHNRVVRVVEEDPDTPWEPTVARQGQAVKSPNGTEFGTFLDESFAEGMRGQYIRQELGGSLPNIPMGTLTAQDLRDNFQLPVSSTYVYKENGHYFLDPSSFAASSLDALVEKDPLLWPAMVEARKTAAGLREVAKRIDRQKSGLYRELRDDYNSEDDFRAGFHHVLMALGKD